MLAVLDYLEEKALRCSGCGLPRDETMSPEAEGRYTVRVLRCHACAVREKAASKFGGARPHEAGGLFFSVEEM